MIPVAAHVYQLLQAIDMVFICMCGDHIVDLPDPPGFEKWQNTVFSHLLFTGTSSIDQNILLFWCVYINAIPLPYIKQGYFKYGRRNGQDQQNAHCLKELSKMFCFFSKYFRLQRYLLIFHFINFVKGI